MATALSLLANEAGTCRNFQNDASTLVLTSSIDYDSYYKASLLPRSLLIIGGQLMGQITPHFTIGRA